MRIFCGVCEIGLIALLGVGLFSVWDGAGGKDNDGV